MKKRRIVLTVGGILALIGLILLVWDFRRELMLVVDPTVAHRHQLMKLIRSHGAADIVLLTIVIGLHCDWPFECDSRNVQFAALHPGWSMLWTMDRFCNELGRQRLGQLSGRWADQARRRFKKNQDQSPADGTDRSAASFDWFDDWLHDSRNSQRFG